jgi:hypothetical protein
MTAAFTEHTGVKPHQSEVNSWQNSLSRIRDLIELAGAQSTYIALEYQVPYNQNRIDCLIFGKDELGKDTVVLIELKQWNSIKSLEDEGNFVETYTGRGERVVPHPSQQVKGYDGYLKSFIADFETENPLVLFSCAYCHNYLKQDGKGLFAPVYKPILEEFPLYTKNDTRELATRIKKLLIKGEGLEVFNRFMQSPVIPSKKLLENVSKIITNKPVFSLLNEQIVAKNLIMAKVKKGQRNNEKSVIIVVGGPGTGKSVIALNVLAEYAAKGQKVFYTCKSKPFLNGLTKLVGENAEKLFSNLYRFVPSKVKENEIDILLVDEAHRIGKSSNFQYTKVEDRTDMPQTDQLIRCARTIVFFIDNKQNVRSSEVGNTKLFRETAKKYSASAEEVELKSQFRCMGSNDYLDWVESILGYDTPLKIFKKSEEFELKIFDDIHEMYQVLRQREEIKPNSARLTAGYCWPWSDPQKDKTLVKDVVIGDFEMPWEAKEGFSLAKGIPKWYEWAYKTKGIEQIGCIYTAQGFEFDYIGVIIGKDMRYNTHTQKLEFDITQTADPTLRRSGEEFEKHVRNIYRVLMTRGMKGCYLYFVDKETENFVRSRME